MSAQQQKQMAVLRAWSRRNWEWASAAILLVVAAWYGSTLYTELQHRRRVASLQKAVEVLKTRVAALEAPLPAAAKRRVRARFDPNSPDLLSGNLCVRTTPNGDVVLLGGSRPILEYARRVKRLYAVVTLDRVTMERVSDYGAAAVQCVLHYRSGD